MRYGFINNFSQLLAADLAAGATTMTLDGGGSQMSDASADLVYVLTLFHVDSNGNETAREIVHVTGVSGDTLTVERAKEGTTAQAWAVGDGVSQRLTAGVVAYFIAPDDLAGYVEASTKAVAIGDGASTFDPEWSNTVAIGQNAGGNGTASVVLGQNANIDSSTSSSSEFKEYDFDGLVVIGSGAYADGAGDTTNGYNSYSVSIGYNAYSGAGNSVAVGYYAEAKKKGATAIGDEAVSSAVDSVAIGTSATVDSDEGVAIGSQSYAQGTRSTAINNNGGASGERSVAIGWWATTGQEGPNADYSTAVGTGAATSADFSVAMGRHAYANPDAEHGVAIGSGARVAVKGGLRLHAVPYLASDPDNNEVDGIGSGFNDAIATQDAVARRTSSQSVIATDPLDLTDGTAAVTLDLPAGTMLFIDAIDVVVTGSDTPGGSPEIVVGPDDVTPAAYLAATAVGKTAIGGRETHSPLVIDGVTSLRVATTTAGTGTTYQAKVVFRGYVMEL